MTGGWVDWHAEFDRMMDKFRAEQAAAAAQGAKDADRQARDREGAEIASLIERDTAAIANRRNRFSGG